MLVWTLLGSLALAAFSGPLIQDDQIFYLDMDTGLITRDPPPMPMAVPEAYRSNHQTDLAPYRPPNFDINAKDLLNHIVDKKARFPEQLMEGIYEVEVLMAMPQADPFHPFDIAIN